MKVQSKRIKCYLKNRKSPQSNQKINHIEKRNSNSKSRATMLFINDSDSKMEKTVYVSEKKIKNCPTAKNSQRIQIQN